MNCLFDSPITFQRELWVDGKKTCWISAHLIAQRNTGWYDQLPRDPKERWLWIKPFIPGTCDGDPAAMEILATANTSNHTREGGFDA
jgi:hypothetical protein